ncbi:MAG: ribosome-associated translation inhibitor RaiA [Actinomycetota bacterium]|nr:ribosome-associated translation inhibitor RaiA [Actinomycetota bacterium]MDZ4179958.1 ribosome-associated translation inhibitor RaiA [Coriobacteriia bacterium]
MNIIIKGRHMAVTDPIREYAEEKIGRVAKIIDGEHFQAEVEIHTEKNPSIENNHVAEVTVWTKGPVIRAKEASTDMYAALDLVSEKLERQFRKYKGKILDRHSGRRAPAPVPSVEPFEPEETEPSIVKTKVLDVKPMMPEEAILQLELLGHDFFVFTSAETETVNVLYRRHDGDYGLIEPRIG